MLAHHTDLILTLWIVGFAIIGIVGQLFLVMANNYRRSKERPMWEMKWSHLGNAAKFTEIGLAYRRKCVKTNYILAAYVLFSLAAFAILS